MSQTSRSTGEICTRKQATLCRKKHPRPTRVPARWRIFGGLELFGIRLGSRRNTPHTPVDSRDSEPTTVRVVRTDEDLMIIGPARRLMRLTAKEGA